MIQANTDCVSSATDTVIAIEGDKTEDTPPTHVHTPPLSPLADIIVPSTTTLTADSTQPKLHVRHGRCLCFRFIIV